MCIVSEVLVLEGRQMPSRGPPVAAFLVMLTNPVNLRAIAATRTGFVRHGVGHQTPFSGRGRRNAAEDLRPKTLQLNTEGLTADKISVIEKLAYKNKAFIIVLQETHCTTADKLVFFFRLSEFFFYPLLAHLDIRAGVEQPFGCLIVQNRQAV